MISCDASHHTGEAYVIVGRILYIFTIYNELNHIPIFRVSSIAKIPHDTTFSAPTDQHQSHHPLAVNAG